MKTTVKVSLWISVSSPCCRLAEGAALCVDVPQALVWCMHFAHRHSTWCEEGIFSIASHAPLLYSAGCDPLPANSCRFPRIPFQSRYTHGLYTWSVHLQYILIGSFGLFSSAFEAVFFLWHKYPVDSCEHFFSLCRCLQLGTILGVSGTDYRSRWPHWALCLATNQYLCTDLRGKGRKKKGQLFLSFPPPLFKYKYTWEQFARSVLLWRLYQA